MLPEFLPHYSVGPFFGFAANAAMGLLCLVISILYRHYRPLRNLFLFYLFLTLLFLGWVIYGLQRSPASILLGYRIDLAALSLLTASWVWFVSTLNNDRPNWLFWTVTGISICLAALALFGQGPWFLGLPLETHQIAENIQRPQSKLLRPLIHFFCLSVCFLYFCLAAIRFFRMKGKRPVYLLPVIVGLLFWFLGGLHDGLRSIGVVILIKDQVVWFTSFWLSLFLTIAVALHFRSLEQAIREARDVFERFVPPAYLRRIATKGLGSIRLGEADQQWVTILCCDIRGFTTLSERLGPSQLVAFVNRLLKRITQVVNDRRGIIDKFLGDAVLCIFEGEDSAEQAVACGVDMLRAVESFNAEEDQGIDQKVQVGIGLHSGPVILGTIGSPERMDSTVLGLTVNLAKRLEEATKRLGVDMLISEEVANRLPDRRAHRLRKLGEVSVRGSSHPVAVVEVYDHNKPEMQNLKERMEPILEEATRLFKSGHLNAALAKLQEALPIFPQDPPLHLLITSLRRVLGEGETTKRMILLDFS
jgi:adenylate cyclase